MNEKVKNEPHVYLKPRILITLLFFILVVALESIMDYYFIALLKSKAKITAMAPVMSRETELEEGLESEEGYVWIDQIKKTLNNMLFLKDPETDMEKEIVEKCMEPFYTTKEIGDGTGIGSL